MAVELAMFLHIIHRTEYLYATPVTFGPHRLLVRPLEGHDVQIRSSALRFSPHCNVRWVRDIFDNCVAIAVPAEKSDRLFFESEVSVEQFNVNPFDFIVEKQATHLPFNYAEEDRLDLGHFLAPCHPEDEPAIRTWLKPFLNPAGNDLTADVLIAVNKSFPLYFSYLRREEPGVQSPGETLRLRSGSCRDFTLLLVEAARILGIAARFVTGYLCQNSETSNRIAIGSTHAWAELYIPGAGWKGFDPTSGILAAHLHIRAGVARTPSQAAPIVGSFLGDPTSFRAMEVDVRVRISESPNFC